MVPAPVARVSAAAAAAAGGERARGKKFSVGIGVGTLQSWNFLGKKLRLSGPMGTRSDRLTLRGRISPNRTSYNVPSLAPQPLSD